ncbi:MAG: hypothetical protein ACM3Q0_07525 [Bacteroidota bacterium]
MSEREMTSEHNLETVSPDLGERIVDGRDHARGGVGWENVRLRTVAEREVLSRTHQSLTETLQTDAG